MELPLVDNADILGGPLVLSPLFLCCEAMLHKLTFL